MMKIFYWVRTENVCLFACDTFENWKETFAVLDAEGIRFNYGVFSDYLGTAVTSDAILYYHAYPDECPSKVTARGIDL